MGTKTEQAGREILESLELMPGLRLPALPWVEPAVKRARDNLADFGFGPISVLRVEDVILSKLFALQGNVRPKDLDDLQSIFEAKPDPDWGYIQDGIRRYSLRQPSTAKELLPEPLRVLLRTHAPPRGQCH